MQFHEIWQGTIWQGIVRVCTLSTATAHTFKQAIPHQNGRVILTLSIMFHLVPINRELFPSLNLDRHCRWEGSHYEQGY
jgi:hypothetical protein